MKPLSFVIITYNRAADMLALAQNISGLHRATELLQDVIVVNNASTDDYSSVENYITNNEQLPFQFINAPENLGVTRGRNFALQFAKGGIIIFLDDDAELQNNDALEQVIHAMQRPGIDGRQVVIVSFKVLYYDTLQMQRNALPHKNFDAYQNKNFFFTYYFAGGAHAIQREILQQVGNLPDTFFYGMEEYDVSYRMLDRGYCIAYDSSIVMLHKESPLGRKPKSDKQRMMWVNKSIVAYTYLPKKYFYFTAVMWSIEYIRKVGFDIGGWIKGWRQVFNIPQAHKRQPLQQSTLQYLKDVEARLWY